MRRQVIGLAFFLAVGVSVTALAQTPKVAPKPAAKPAAKAAASGSAAASASAAPAASSATPAAAAGSAPAASPSAAGSSPAVPIPTQADGATYSVRLRDLEARVDELKDQIRRSHTRLSLLSDTILTGGAAGSRAEIIFRNEMSSAFRLVKAAFIIDGAVQYNRQDETGVLADQKEIPLFSGSMPPGDHMVQAVLQFQGNGYGVFTYLRGYKFDVRNAHSFTVVEGKAIVVTGTSLEKGGVTTPLEQRPQFEWNEKIQPLGSAPSTAAPKGGGGVSATPSSSGVGGSLSIGGGK